ncbi:MAG: efflux RND transporter permease subunit [Phycisphaerae bacterium]|nr:efflux RND transporter permease subunit [Phycisphaerae bacterium]
MSTAPSRGREHRGAIAWMARNGVAPNLLMIVLIGGGLLWAMRIKQEVFPDFDLDTVTVSVAYPGASPAEVEQGIILAIEEAVQGLDGVEEVVSLAKEGVGVVNIELLRGADHQKAAQDIQSEVDRIQSFPEEIEEPEVVLLTHRREVIELVIYGDQDERVLRQLAEDLREQLLQDPGITLVELMAVRPLEISIEVPQENLRAYNLTLEQIAQKVRQAAVELPGGGIKTRGGEILVRMMERRDYGRQFADIPVLSRNDGTVVLLGDIAKITDGFEDTDEFATCDGKPAIKVEVYRVGDQTPIQVSDLARKHLARFEETLPPGVFVTVWDDRSDIYRQRMDLLLRNGYLGLTLVFVLLAVFLEARLAFWVAMGIPISFLGGFIFLPMMDVSINMISLFAFIVALGIVVDDAIVVGENTYEWHQRGLPFLQAAIRGAREVMVPVIFSVLTNVATFLPLFFIPGILGKIFRVIPAVVVTVFLVSLVESLLILPAHLGHQRERRRGSVRAWLHRGQQSLSAWIARQIKDVYGPFLDKALEHRYLTLAVSIAVLAVTAAYVQSGRMGMTMFPRVESDKAYATAVLPYGSAVESTEKVEQHLIRAAKEVIAEHGGEKLAEGVWAYVFGHQTEVSVRLTQPEVRPVQTAEFVKLWREKAGAIPGLESISFQSDRGGPGSGAVLTIELSHRDIGVLEKASAELAEAISLYPNAKDVDDGFSPGKQQFDFRILPEGRSLGLTAVDVARQVRSSYYGAEVLRQQRGRNEVKVMVRLPEDERISEYNLEELLVRTPMGKEVPIREAVRMSRGRAYTEINRRNGRRTVTVTADVDPPSQAGQIIGDLEDAALPALMRKYQGLSYSFQGKQADMAESMEALKSGLIMAMLGVYILLAVPLRSYIQPAIIMTSIPFGMIGAVMGHMIMGYSLSILSFMGMVALAGVVVNDSLVLIDFANREFRSGKSHHDAIHAAGVRRFRPIILTSLTTFGGLAPMILETSRQAKFLVPMALSLGYGILFATLIALLLVPCLYLIVEDVRRLFGVRDAAEVTASLELKPEHA